MDKQNRESLLHDVEAFCSELRPTEEICYVEHTFNDQLIPLCQKYHLLGIPVKEEYGGRGADSLTYTRSLERIGMEGTGVRTFFSGHTSIGQMPIQMWGSDNQKERYLPPSTRGEKILAFGLTEPDAGSNPLEMKMSYEFKDNHYVLNGVKYLISNAGIAHAIIAFAYPKNGVGKISAFIVDTDKEGDGFKIAMSTLMSGRLSVAAGCLGVIADCLNEAVRYAKERNQHGKPIAK